MSCHNVKTDMWSILILTLSMILWASSLIVLKYTFKFYDPMFVIFCRMIIGSIFFIPFIKMCNGSTYHKGDFKYLIMMGLFEPCLYFLFEAKALVYTSASQAGVITALMPLLVILGARVFLKEKITIHILFGVIIAVIGIVLLTLKAKVSVFSPNPLIGNTYEFIAMLCASLYAITLKHIIVRYNPLFLTSFQAIIGSVFFLSFVLFRPTSIPTSFDILPMLSIAYLGIFVTFGAYGLYNKGVKRMPVCQASAFMSLIPVFTIFLGWLILGESLTLIQYLAVFMVFIGVFISQSGNKMCSVFKENYWRV